MALLTWLAIAASGLVFGQPQNFGGNDPEEKKRGEKMIAQNEKAFSQTEKMVAQNERVIFKARRWFSNFRPCAGHQLGRNLDYTASALTRPHGRPARVNDSETGAHGI